MGSRWVVSALLREGEAVRRALADSGWLDNRRSIDRRGDRLLVPVRGPLPKEKIAALGGESLELDLPARTKPDPHAEVLARLPPALAVHAPRHYERIGDVLVLRLPPELEDHRQEVAEAYAAVLRAKSVVIDRGIEGPWRQPDVERVYGSDMETVHTEDGVRYALDVAKVMFSSGNLAERMRMGHVVRPGETVVDLFAGIGYFALPMAVHGKPAKVVAIEVNPEAFAYLEANVRLNRAWCVEPVLGDCRDVAPSGVADRIVMGYLRGESYLDIAMRAARDGCVLHYHEATPRESVPKRPWSRVEKTAKAAGFRAELLAVHRIKSYAPGVQHVVLDAVLCRGRTAGEPVT